MPNSCLWDERLAFYSTLSVNGDNAATVTWAGEKNQGRVTETCDSVLIVGVRVRVRACFPCRRPWRFSEGWSWKQRRWTAACSRGKPPAPWCRAGPINTQDTALGYPVTWRLAARSPPPQLTPPLQGPKYQILSIYDSDSIVIYQSFWFPRHPRFSLCPRNSRQTNKETNIRDEWWLPLPHTLQNPPILLHLWARHRWETHTHTHARGCIRENASPMLGNDDEQSLGQRLQQAWCVLASHYAAPIWARSCSARSSSRRWEGLSCLSRVRPEKHTSKREHFFWYVPSCLGPTYIQLLFFYFLSMHSLFFLFIT